MSNPAVTLAAEIRSASARLARAGVPSPEADAVLLAAYVLGCEPEQIRRAMILGDPADPAVAARLADLVGERSRRVPLQHLTGVAHFRGLTLGVGPGVFIPRPETEVVAQAVIDEALALTAETTSPVVLDLGTGSGALALAVKDEVPAAEVTAVELDPLAVGWARHNRDRTGLDIEIIHGDATAELPELAEYRAAVDIVVSNPPYIPTGMVPVDPEVRDHDPELALYGGSADGLAIPLAVAQRAASLLRPGGLFVMEHADSHGEALPARLVATGAWTEVADHVDLTGRPRYVTARRT